jgi:NADPH-ferrihemoprotein reductase
MASRTANAAIMAPIFFMYMAVLAAAEEKVKEEEESVAVTEEGYFSTTDYVILAALGIGAIWYFFLKDKKEEPSAPAYVIQPASMPAPTSSNKGFVEKMRTSTRRMVVFYGSQTGTAEEFAGRLAKEGARYGCKGVVADPEESEMEEICSVAELKEELNGETVAVFMMATYGEGDPTDNCQEFFDWLKEGEVDLKGGFKQDGNSLSVIIREGIQLFMDL